MKPQKNMNTKSDRERERRRKMKGKAKQQKKLFEHTKNWVLCFLSHMTVHAFMMGRWRDIGFIWDVLRSLTFHNFYFYIMKIFKKIQKLVTKVCDNQSITFSLKIPPDFVSDFIIIHFFVHHAHLSFIYSSEKILPLFFPSLNPRCTSIF